MTREGRHSSRVMTLFWMALRELEGGAPMISVTRLNGADLVVNDDLIEFIERTPETVLTMTEGKKITIKESAEQVLEKIVSFRKSITLPEIRD